MYYRYMKNVHFFHRILFIMLIEYHSTVIIVYRLNYLFKKFTNFFSRIFHSIIPKFVSAFFRLKTSLECKLCGFITDRTLQLFRILKNDSNLYTINYYLRITFSSDNPFHNSIIYCANIDRCRQLREKIRSFYLTTLYIEVLARQLYVGKC